jgi:uncharacterized protein YggT (Ycf19 family)
MLLDAITQVELFLNVFIGVYVLVIFLYILTSWIQLPYSLRPVQRFLYDVCEPYLRIFRRLLPSFGAFDFSPIIAILTLGIVDRVINSILDRLH